MKKNITKFVVLCVIAGFSLSACKKDAKKTDDTISTYPMSFTLNGTAVTYNACTITDIDVDGTHSTEIVGLNTKTPNNTLQIKLTTGVSDLKVAQSYLVTEDNLDAYTSTFFYSPDGTNRFTTQSVAPLGIVTITNITSTTIKGTFSAKLYAGNDYTAASLKYTITSGTFVAQL